MPCVRVWWADTASLQNVAFNTNRGIVRFLRTMPLDLCHKAGSFLLQRLTHCPVVAAHALAFKA